MTNLIPRELYRFERAVAATIRVLQSVLQCVLQRVLQYVLQCVEQLIPTRALSF